MQVKCTSCGASQSISQAQSCDFCGNLIELESAKSNYQKAMQSENGNLMTMAETAIEATNWEEALQFFNQVLTKDISNSDAWLGKGIAIVYTSKIGDLKIKEAIAYWKNALKHSPNQEAMGKRVAKEIDLVVNKFYPTLENHFVQFKDLDNSYGELVEKFVILEGAQDYAVKLDPTNITLAKTGYLLCRRVIDTPKNHALADFNSAIAGAVISTFQKNKYKQDDNFKKMSKARDLKKLIEQAAAIVGEIEMKYQNMILALVENDQDLRKMIEINVQNKKVKAEEIKRKADELEVHKKNGDKFAALVVGSILCYVILGPLLGAELGLIVSLIASLALYPLVRKLLFS